MSYTIKKLAELAGISTRTLRYYDEIGLLSPQRIQGSEYRIYEKKDVDRLQQIMFYREMGVELSAIKEILDSESFDYVLALRSHLLKLKKKRKQLDLLIENVTKTIQKEEGIKKMSDQEKFQGFKEELVRNNEEKYGKEIRSKYGDESMEASKDKMLNLSKEEYDKMMNLEEEIMKYLCEAVRSNEDPKSELGMKVANLHKQWLSISVPKYSTQLHRGLALMYISDERFTQYYDKEVAGCAQFLSDAILANILDTTI